ncbi:MAG: hypothetical protein AB1486_27185 [Planctomycetota bacterium]
MSRKGKRRWTRRAPGEVAQIVEDYRASGLSQSQFAAKRGVAPATLSWWLRRRGERSGSRLVPVRLLGGPPHSSWFEIVVGNGRVVRVGSGFDPDTLSALLRVVEQTSC